MHKVSDFRLGVIMLNTHFPRVIGDIGNPDSFSFPVLYRTVPSAKVDAIVTPKGVDPAVKEDILAILDRLNDEGADLIVTTCGFLGEMQTELQSYSPTPVLTSSLMTIPFVRNIIGSGKKIGVLTFDAKSLNQKHFNGHYGDDIIIGEIPKDGHLYKVIKQDLPALDEEKAEAETVNAALQLINTHPDIEAIVLECTNLSPYINQIRETIKRPVFDIIQAINWFRNSKA